MKLIEWTFHLRWILWAAGVLLCLAYLPIPKIRRIRLAIADPLRALLERRFHVSLAFLCIAFVLLAWAGKYSQLLTFQLNALDFWLFEDMIRNMSEGGFFITRFAPQTAGFVQHGAVHGTFTWATTLPLSWILGPTQAALLYGPLALGLGAWFFGLLCAPQLGRPGGFIAAAAFLVSTQVGKVLNYDVHPEIAYPLFTFLWAWSLGLGDGRVRWLGLILATVGGIGIKEDSFLVFFPWILWGIWKYPGRQRRASIVSFVLALGAFGFQMFAMSRWSSGAWGPSEWQGLPVKIPGGPDLLMGKRWTSLSDAGEIFSLLLASHGGFIGALEKFGRFLISRPWLSLVIFAPWVLAQLRFWLTLAPLAAAYSLLQRASILNIYYAAPFLGSFWVNAMIPSRNGFTSGLQKSWPVFSLAAALLLGDGAIEIHVPSREAKELRNEVTQLIPCIEQAGGRGLVQGHLLGLVPRERVLTERIPQDPAMFAKMTFVLVTPEVGSYEMPREASRAFTRTLQESGWKDSAERCESRPGSIIRLFLKTIAPSQGTT